MLEDVPRDPLIFANKDVGDNRMSVFKSMPSDDNGEKDKARFLDRARAECLGLVKLDPSGEKSGKGNGDNELELPR